MNQPGAHYGYPQPPPSPPMDETSRCSLPSISNLLVMADAGSPTSEHSPQSQAGREPFGLACIEHFVLRMTTASSIKADTRPNSSHYSSNGPSRSTLPPTPPMSTEPFEVNNSPSTKPLAQIPVLSGPGNYYYETTPPVEDVHRQHLNPTVTRLPMQPQSYSPQAFASSYLNQPSMTTFYAPSLPTAQSQISGLFYQRPLPQVGRSLPTPYRN